MRLLECRISQFSGGAHPPPPPPGETTLWPLHSTYIMKHFPMPMLQTVKSVCCFSQQSYALVLKMNGPMRDNNHQH